MGPKDLALQLARTESETEIIRILTDEGYWDDYSYWRPFGDNENNFSTIGNQQSKADSALVEKIINSVDAMLMKECWKAGIDPTGSSAPKSISEALERFYNVKDGLIQNLSNDKRNEMSQNIILAATGSTRKMNLVIADKGEGQTPNAMPNTILSINQSNKLKVPFVQGKFNMGGTGALPFCGDSSIQLIISKKCPDIANPSDPTSNRWSITIVRRESPRESRKSSMYTYLTQKSGKLFDFEAKKLNIIPVPLTADKVSRYQDMEYGTYIKLFNYAIQGYKSNILFDFNYRLSLLMPSLSHPVRLRECRDYSGHTLETTLSGLVTRLEDDRKNNLEPGFPDSNSFYIENQKFGCQIYVFKEVIKDGKLVPTSRNYREDDGIIFVVNGQTHGNIPDSFFNRVNLPYLAKSLLVIVDCSDVDIVPRENIFMNSRDRLRDGSFTRDVILRIKEILTNHPGLKNLQNERRAAAIRNKISEDKPLENVLQNILTKSPVLSKLLIAGLRLQNPFNLENHSGVGKDFKGKKHPTYFTLIGQKDNSLTLMRPMNHGFRVQFETDVENDYFNREVNAGELLISLDGEVCPQYIRHLGLFNGIATLTLDMPKEVQKEKKYSYKVWLKDSCIVSNFESDFSVIPTKPEDYTGSSTPGKRIPPSSKTKDDSKRQKPGQLALPSIYEVCKDQWAEYGMKEDSALVVKRIDDNMDFFINMDNIHLLVELKGSRDLSKDALTKARYKYSIALIGMSLISYYLSHEEESSDIDYNDEVRIITSVLSPIIIPLLDSMADLDLSDVA